MKPLPEEAQFWNVKCAGMPERCKELFLLSFNEKTKECVLDKDCRELLASDYTEDELEFLQTTRTIDDFKVGLIVPGKLLPHTIAGGVVLEDVLYEIREQFRF